MVAAQNSEFRNALIAERQATLERIAALSQDLTSIFDSAQFTSTDDEHDPEGATIAFERSQASSLLAASHAQLAEVNAALERIRVEAYGLCEHCGTTITHDRLLARPTARTCITCTTALGQ